VTAPDWGVAPGYWDAAGQWHDAPPETVDAILGAMDADRDEAPPTESDAVVVARAGAAMPVGRGRLVLEDGGEMLVAGELPSDVPLGYHRIVADDRPERLLVVSPGRCHLPELRAWGFAVQLYALRSAGSWGVGDLADLAELGRWSAAELGAGFCLVNPLHAARPTLPQVASPYSPSSRVFRNPLYLRVAGDDGRALNSERRIDRDAVFQLKMAALAREWEDPSAHPGPEFDAWCIDQGRALVDYATFCALDERIDGPWPQWPAPLRGAGSDAVATFRHQHAARVLFHMWLQWRIDRQLAEAGRTIPLCADLAVGVEPNGADAWMWPDAFARGVAVGAPPDEFNTQGQNWGLPPFDPWRLRAMAYEPFIRTMRSAFAHAGGVRLDHVMGLFRQFWIPEGLAPTDGTYVRYPAADLLDIVALESTRAGAWLVGEDLGTVENEVRAELMARDVLSYRLLWFEDRPPTEYPERALAAVTTHDLPTVAGLWSGADLEAQRRIGTKPNERGTAELRERVRALASVDEDAPVDEVVRGVYRALGDAPSRLLAATLDDPLAVEERPNMPGTVDEWPNWSRALPKSLEEIQADPRVAEVGHLLRRG
jgi:4-alpha-glucanotransferase